MRKTQINEAIEDADSFGSEKERKILKMFFYVVKEMGHEELIISKLSNWHPNPDSNGK